MSFLCVISGIVATAHAQDVLFWIVSVNTINKRQIISDVIVMN